MIANNDVNPDLLAYATDKHIPLLDYCEDFADAYEAFYDKICPDTEE